MKIIEILSEKIDEEINDAKSYIEMSIKYKEEYPELSRTLANISAQEMEHMNLLHNEVVILIKKYRETKGEPPAAGRGGTNGQIRADCLVRKKT